MNKKYTAILGLKPSQGARSPKLWNKVYKKISSVERMIPIDIPQKNFKKKFNSLKKDKNFLGGAVTVPYKEACFRLLKTIKDKRILQIGAVNCLYRNEKGKLVGTNTDGEAALEVFNNEIKKKKIKKLKTIAILGYGGVGKAIVAYFSSYYKNSSILVFTRYKKTRNFKNVSFINLKNFNNYINDITALINCTSVGFMNNKSLLIESQISSLNKCSVIYDVIYQPKVTKLMSYAKKNKIFTFNGLKMNLEQAVLAFKITNNVKVNSKMIREIMRK